MTTNAVGVGVPRPRVVICEDSRTYAAALRRTLEHGGELDVVGVYSSAEQALAALPRLEPDLVTMDIELPGMSGLEAVELIMSSTPVPILVVSGQVGPRTEETAAALAAGALEALPKSELDLSDPASGAAAALRRRAKMLSGAIVIRHPRARLGAGRRSSTGRVASVIGVCASTGGPHALAALLSGLAATYRVPMLVVQHMASGFTEGLARWLDSVVPLPVQLARDGDRVGPGVWIAPEGAHLVLREGDRLALDRRAASGLHRPSADMLLQSLAATAAREAVAVVLTGMGRDGAEGLKAVRAAGGLTIAQDEQSSAVFGMPRAAAEQGAELVLPLQQIASVLSDLVARASVR